MMLLIYITSDISGGLSFISVDYFFMWILNNSHNILLIFKNMGIYLLS